MTVGGTREKLSMIATVTNQGKTRWMIIDDVFDAEKLIEFLAALIQDAGKKVFLILDNLRVHHSKIVKAWPDNVPISSIFSDGRHARFKNARPWPRAGPGCRGTSQFKGSGLAQAALLVSAIWRLSSKSGYRCVRSIDSAR